MKFCTHCGEKLPENSKFCNACGKPIIDETQEEHPQHALLNQLLIASMAFMGVYFVIALLGKDPIGILLSIGMAVALYFLGYQKILIHDYETPQIVCLIIGVILGLLSFIGVLSGQVVAVVGLLGASLPLYAWWILQQKNSTTK